MTDRPASYRILVVDSEGHTAAVLAERIVARGHVPLACGADTAQVAREVSAHQPHALVLDYHLERPVELEVTDAAKRADPSMPVIAITSPGPALRSLEAWNATRRCIDQVIRKPLEGDTFFKSLEALAGARQSSARATRYASLIPEDGVRYAEEAGTAPAFAEMAVLFTDIRRSTELASTVPLREWFESINRSLSDQSAVVRDNGGAVVKYTGDGLMASFRGRGRAHRALRCAIALQELDRTADYRRTVRIGLGLAEGLVMTGLIGVPGRQQYDVIGATVHLAARLCGIAGEGEIVATPRLVRSAGMTGSMPPAARSVNLRGFATPVDCVSFSQLNEPRP